MGLSVLLRRVVLVASLLVAVLMPAAAENNSMFWQVRSEHPYRVQIVFYSEWRNWEWPGGSQAYNLDDYETQGFNLGCQPGEKICFGAWETGNAGAIYWGVGYRRSQRCSACCFICGDGPIPVQVLKAVNL